MTSGVSIHGRKHSEKTKKKMSETRKRLYVNGDLLPSITRGMFGKSHTKENKIRQSILMKKRYLNGLMNLTFKGRRHSEHSKIKISEAHIGKKRAYSQIGKILSVETKKKISETRKRLFAEGKITSNLKKYIGCYGKDNPMYGRLRSDLSMWNKNHPRIGVKHSEASKHKMSLANRGRDFSELTLKKMSAVKQGIKLEDWKKFTGKEPYGEKWTFKLKRKIRKRDNQVCMNCGIHREKLKEELHVHHVNYDKLLSIEDNLISLCRGCHRHTNYNREYWTKLFQEKLSKLYGYKYTSEGKIIINVEVNKNE
jgi:hypothetical protein